MHTSVEFIPDSCCVTGKTRIHLSSRMVTHYHPGTTSCGLRSHSATASRPMHPPIQCRHQYFQAIHGWTTLHTVHLLRAWGTKQMPEPFAVASCSFIRVSGDSFKHPADNLCPAERTLSALSLEVRSQVCGNPTHYAARLGSRNVPRIARADGVMETRLMDGEESRHACREPTIALGRLLDRARQTVGRCVRALRNFHERQDNEDHSEFSCQIRTPPIV